MKGSVKSRPGKNGVKTWRIRVDAGIDEFTGRRRQVSRTFRGSQSGADRLLRKLMTELENGTHVSPNSITVSELMDRWLKSVAVKVRPNTLDCYRGPIRTYIEPVLGKLRATSLVPERVNGFYRELMASNGARTKRPLSPRTVQLTHRILSMAFDWGISQQIVGRNPARAASPPRPRRPEIHVPDSGTTSQILEHLQAHSPWVVPIVAFAVRTGMRRGEIVALQWRDVDLDAVNPSVSVRRSIVFLDNGDISVGAPKTASGTRNVLLDNPTVALLRERRSEVERMATLRGIRVRTSDHVFGDVEGRPVRSSSISRAFRRAAQAVGSPVTAFHSVRHLHATELLKVGVHPRIVQDRLGHGDIAVTLNTYSHVEPGLQVKAADAFNQAFDFDMPISESESKKVLA